MFMAGCMVQEDPAPDVCIRKILNFGHWSLHVVKKILAPGKGSEIRHLISSVAADASFLKTCLSFVVHKLYRSKIC